MPFPAAIVPNTRLNTTLPPTVAARLQIHLFSAMEGRVPKGAIQAFLVERIQEFFNSKRLDLAPYLGTLPGEVVVSGTEHSISCLINRLQGVPHAKGSI